MKRRSPWWGEHRSRYYWAAEIVAGRSVLDVGCGTGYGLQILSDGGAECVTGVDYDPTAMGGIHEIRSEGIWCCAGDARRLPLKSEEFDVVTSFEVLEHLERANEFLSEVERVLKSGGTFLVSTPNALVTMPIGGKPKNPFHVHEYEPPELADLLQRHFGSVRIMGQTMADSFEFCPLWSIEHRSNQRLRGALWTTIHHFVPFDVKDRIARLRHNQGFYPGEYDFDFRSNATLQAHVLVASCRK